jgi:hypothetical protein
VMGQTVPSSISYGLLMAKPYFNITICNDRE